MTRCLLMPAMLASVCVLFTVFTCTRAYNNGMGATPPMGWNTWCTDDVCGLIDNCYESEIKSVADAIVAQGLDKLGYEYVNMDDCWSATTRDSSGQLQPDAKRFPSGMKALADYVHSKGLKIGLYTCVGTKTCKRGRPGTYGKWKTDADTMAAWGIDFVKADFCNRPSGTVPEELYGNYSQALNATGRPILFSLCNWGEGNVTEWGGNVGQMFRFQMDHLPLWHYPPQAAGLGFGQGSEDIIEYMATLKPSTIVKQYGWMDPDFLETLFPLTMPFTDSRTEYTFWTLWSAPLLIATDVRNMSTQLASIITNPEVIAIDQDASYTAGDRIFNNTDGGQLWARPLANGDHAVVLYNRNEFFDATVSFNFTDVGIPAGTTVSIRDLWARADLGSKTDGYSARVSPHDVVYLRLSAGNSTGTDDVHSRTIRGRSVTRVPHSK